MDTRELRKNIRQLPALAGAPAGPHDWRRWQRDLRDLILIDGPENFLGWPPIYHTMLVNHNLTAVQAAYEALRSTADWPLWQAAVTMPTYGKPPDYLPATEYSASLLYQAHNLYLWQEHTGQRISDLQTIVEVGGGFGACAYVARKIGFTGRYIIVDLPEFALLAEHVLSQRGITDIEYVVSGDYQRQTPCDLLIAMRSLSEMPLTERSAALDNYPARAHLISYTAAFQSYNNLDWMRTLIADWQGELWQGLTLTGEHCTVAWSPERITVDVPEPAGDAEPAEQPAEPTAEPVAEPVVKQPAKRRTPRAKR